MSSRVVVALCVVLAAVPFAGAAIPGSHEAENAPAKSTGAVGTSAAASGGQFWNLWANGFIEDSFTFSTPEDVSLEVRAAGSPLGGVFPRMRVLLDGSQVADVFVTGTFTWYAGSARALAAGTHVVRVEFTNDAVSASEDRNLYVDAFRFVAGTPVPPPAAPTSREVEAFAVRTTGAQGTSASASGGAFWNLWANGYVEDTLAANGTDALVVRARGEPLGGVWPHMRVLVGGVLAGEFDVTSADWAEYSVAAPAAGTRPVRFQFTNDAVSASEDRNLHLDLARIGGASPPPPPPPPPPSGGIEVETFATKTTGALGSSPSATGGSFWNLWANGHVEDSFKGDGTALRIVARGEPLGGVWPQMQLLVDSVVVNTWTVNSPSFVAYTGPTLDSNGHVVRIRFTNDARSSSEDRNLHLDTVLGVVRAAAPPPPPPPPTSQDRREAEAFSIRTTGALSSSGLASGGQYWNLWANGHIEDTLASSGSAPLVVRARGTPAAGVWPIMQLRVDGVLVNTWSVTTASFADFVGATPTAGTHTIRVSFTNDAVIGSEDRNLHLDVVSHMGTAGGSTLRTPYELDSTSGFSSKTRFSWPGGPGYLAAHAGTPPGLNLHPTLRLALGQLSAQAVIPGPTPRPLLLAFDLPAGDHDVWTNATGGPVHVELLERLDAPWPRVLDGSEARTKTGGSAVGTSWRLTDYARLEQPLVVDTSGWYLLRVTGTGTVDSFGPLVFLQLNRTVVAERFFTTSVDLSAKRFLHAGVGYTMGVSYENPLAGGGRSLTVATLSATPTSAPPAPAPAVPVDPFVDPAGWPAYGGDDWGTRNSDDANGPRIANVSTLALRWRVQLDQVPSSTPVVDGGAVYITTWAGSVYAFNEASGALLWRRVLPDRIDASVLATPSLIIAHSDRTVYALHRSTGATAWTHVMAGHLWASPVALGDSLIIAGDSSPGQVKRLRLSDGVQMWEYRTGVGDIGARIWTTPVVPPGSDLVVFGTSPGTPTAQPPTMDAIIALNATTGAAVWVHQFFLGDTNIPDNHIDSNRDFGSSPQLAMLDGRPVVIAAQKHGPVWVVDLTTGALVHGGIPHEGRIRHVGSSAVAGNVIVASSTSPETIAGYDLLTGDLLWTRTLGATNFAPVATGNGIAWIGTWTGQLEAFDLNTGAPLLSLSAGGGVTGGASLANGRVYVGSASGGSPGSINFNLPGALSVWWTPPP